jgi:hypothetical protein
MDLTRIVVVVVVVVVVVRTPSRMEIPSGAAAKL